MNRTAGMTLKDFLDRVIDEGIKACSDSYKDDRKKREGAIAGFEACRDKTVFELRQQLHLAENLANVSRATDPTNYWYHRCKHAEIEWVCNVLSSALHNQGLEPIVTPTMRGFLQAAAILGVTKDLSLKDVDEN